MHDDLKFRPGLMEMATHQFAICGIEPAIWKVEDLDRRKDCEKVVAAAKRNGRDDVGCIVSWHGEKDLKVQEWLATVPASKDSLFLWLGGLISGSRSSISGRG